MKKAEQEFTGGDVVSESVEMAGWGVEEATEKNKRDASTSLPSLDPFSYIFPTSPSFKHPANTSPFFPLVKVGSKNRPGIRS